MKIKQRFPINSQRILLKYSWRVYERKLLESVSIPTKSKLQKRNNNYKNKEE